MTQSQKKPTAGTSGRKGPKPANKRVARNISAVLSLRPQGTRNNARADAAREGICKQCVNAQYCTYPKTKGRPVMFCGEFEGYPPVKTPNVSNIKDTRPVVSPSQPRKTEEPVTIFRGLCSTCENRNDCEYPKPEGGVWRCEEYE